MPDEDIMDRLREIDEDEIVGEEVTLDDDLDFEGLDDMDNPPFDAGAAPSVAPAIAPPAPKTRGAREVKMEKPAKKPAARTKSSKSKTKEAAKDTLVNAETSVTEVEEVVVKAKVLRIVVDKVIIEPGNNISLSSS